MIIFLKAHVTTSSFSPFALVFPSGDPLSSMDNKLSIGLYPVCILDIYTAGEKLVMGGSMVSLSSLAVPSKRETQCSLEVALSS